MRLGDQIVIGLGVVVLLVIGAVCSRRNQTAEGYFLAGRSMPGWVVGCSLMATIVSSMAFIGHPVATYYENAGQFTGPKLSMNPAGTWRVTNVS